MSYLAPTVKARLRAMEQLNTYPLLDSLTPSIARCRAGLTLFYRAVFSSYGAGSWFARSIREAHKAEASIS